MSSVAEVGPARPVMSLTRIVEMNIGFLGLQFSFGLQQGNMAPIYSYLGAKEAALPILQLAGPVTGLLVQPLVGALSDRTISPLGRRTPYFLIGALMCSLGLLSMPHSTSLWMAASLLWLLDAGNNIMMDPYRAYVGDRLDETRRGTGFLIQSAFTGLAQMLAFATPSILVYGLGVDRHAVDQRNIPIVTHMAFAIGAVLSVATILWSVVRVPEPPLSPAERARIRAASRSLAAVVGEIWSAIVQMPPAMRKLAWMCLFQWYAMGVFWSYVIYSIGRSVFGTSDPLSPGFREAVLVNGQMAAFYNGVAFVAALALAPISRRHGARATHAACLILAGAAMLALPHVQTKALLFLPAVGIGLGWASMMGNPYAMVAACVPPERTGVYMGVFNMMIVAPMMLIAATLPFFYDSLLGGDPRRVITLAGALLVCAALAVLRVSDEDLRG